jgi:phage gp16-like protein
MSHRKHLIKLVHMGALLVGLDESARRALQLRVAGHASCKDMDEPRLRAVIRELNRLGAKLTLPAPKPAGSDRAPLLGKLRAIMQADAHAEAYVLGISRKMWGEQSPEDLAWHSPKQLRALIAALMYHRRRRAKECASA